MVAQCSPTNLDSHTLETREVVGKFDGGSITSEAGQATDSQAVSASPVRYRINICTPGDGRSKAVELVGIDPSGRETICNTSTYVSAGL